MTTNLRNLLVASALLAPTFGCSFMARGPEQYRDDTAAVLAQRNAQIKSCYDKQLDTDETVNGKVVVNFTVEKKTGMLTNVVVDESQTTAPKPLAACIVSAMDGLQLTPEDQRDGLATFVWEFKVGSPRPAA